MHLAIEGGVLALSAAAGAALIQRGSVPEETVAIFLGSFAFSMVFLTPDLDLVRSRPTRRWGRLSFLWWPYAKVFRHRGVSHHLVWGPLTRIGYLALLATAGVAIVEAALGRPISFTAPHTSVWAILAGLYVPNIVHTAVDAAASPRRRRS